MLKLGMHGCVMPLPPSGRIPDQIISVPFNFRRAMLAPWESISSREVGDEFCEWMVMIGVCTPFLLIIYDWGTFCENEDVEWAT